MGPGNVLDGIRQGSGSSSGADVESSGRFCGAQKRSGQFWAALDGAGRFQTAWKALDGSMELARSLSNVGNHALTIGGKHILLLVSQCFTLPKRARLRK